MALGISLLHSSFGVSEIKIKWQKVPCKCSEAQLINLPWNPGFPVGECAGWPLTVLQCLHPDGISVSLCISPPTIEMWKIMESVVISSGFMFAFLLFSSLKSDNLIWINILLHAKKYILFIHPSLDAGCQYLHFSMKGGNEWKSNLVYNGLGF